MDISISRNTSSVLAQVFGNEKLADSITQSLDEKVRRLVPIIDNLLYSTDDLPFGSNNIIPSAGAMCLVSSLTVALDQEVTSYAQSVLDFKLID